ncbi:hypothetical protein [Ammoniphilus sp. YIM 78166]|uniref:hypothetical protein n=1 Tax=Ammoniphilus sp. YIM 78166 TaxID=1644106 RepID=UPI001F101B0E|nr:hypothetical protein [Ammoniphilus sp. YIM 78166]
MGKSNEALQEIQLSHHSIEQWQRRKRELEWWVNHPKPEKRPKSLKWLKQDYVDEELYPVLQLLNQAGIPTEYSCAGVSLLDDPHDHSLYAYLTFYKKDLSSALMEYLLNRMKHRVIVVYEPARNRYDVSSFYIQHNRSFCLLLYHCAIQFLNHDRQEDNL